MTLNVFALVVFGAAFLTSLAATPMVRRLALACDVLDRPGPGKSHGLPTPYLGGLAVLAGVGAGNLGITAWGELGGVILGAAMLTAVGFTDDMMRLPAFTRLSIQFLAAAIAVAGGIRAAPTGSEAVDVALTLVWLVGITNAFNLLDNMNGLSAGAAAIAALCFFAAALPQGQYLTGALALSVAGGALGFLPHNFPRARIFMGDAGSLLLGFLVAVVSLEVVFPIAQPWSFAIPLAVLGLPVIDTTVVVADRLRKRRSVFVGGSDHLSHRLTALGLSPAAAVAVLLGVAAFLGVAGVLVGLRVLPMTSLLAALAMAASGGLVALAMPLAPATEEARRRVSIAVHRAARRGGNR